jgi:hypothetical protein
MSSGKQTGAAVILGLLLAGCGGSSNKSDGGLSGSGGSSNKTDGGLSGSGCAAYASAFCAEIQTCAPGLFPIFGFADNADCQALYTRSCNDSLVAPRSGWTASLAEQCGRGYAGMNCATFLGQGGVPAACLAHGGTVANGGACSTPYQCVSGRCSLTALGQCGTCVPAAALGQPCANDEFAGGTCADNLVCALTPASPTATVCAAPVSMGGACADPSVCPVNGYCDPATHVCTKLPGVGASCGGKGIYFCDPTQTGSLCDYASSTCLSATVAPSGGACGMVANSYSNCSISGTCNIVGDAGAGTCTPFDGGSCAGTDLCTTPNCLDPIGCATVVCAGTVDAATSPAAAWEGSRPARLRRAPIGFAFGSRR